MRARTRQPARRRGSGRRSVRWWRGWRGEARRVAHRLRREARRRRGRALGRARARDRRASGRGRDRRRRRGRPDRSRSSAARARAQGAARAAGRNGGRGRGAARDRATRARGGDGTARRRVAARVVVLDDARLLPRADAPVLRRGRRGGRAAAGGRRVDRARACSRSPRSRRGSARSKTQRPSPGCCSTCAAAGSEHRRPTGPRRGTPTHHPLRSYPRGCHAAVPKACRLSRRYKVRPL